MSIQQIEKIDWSFNQETEMESEFGPARRVTPPETSGDISRPSLSRTLGGFSLLLEVVAAGSKTAINKLYKPQKSSKPLLKPPFKTVK